jgi:hypothetical protein
MAFVDDALCHWMEDGDSNDKSKGMSGMFGHLMWHAAIALTKVGVLMDVLLQDL